MELKERVALITGGAGRIGGAVVRSLAKAGVSGVAINYRKSSKEAADLAAEIERGGVKAAAIQADVQNDAQARKIRVNCVAPAFTDTPWMSGHYGENYQQVISQASAGYPLQRIATPDEVAGALLGLITGGDFVTGQTLIVD